MKSKGNLSSYSEYLLFLYIYLANSDFNLHLLEIDTIFTKMKVLFPNEPNREQIYYKVKNLYDSIDLTEVESFIEENYKLFKPQISNPDQLFTDFYDLITSDGIVQDYEIQAFDKIKKIIKR